MVAVKNAPHLTRRQHQIRLFTIITQQETKTITMAKHFAFDQIELVDQRIGTSAVAQHLTIALHRRQTATDSFDQLFVFQTQQAAHIFMGNRLAIRF